MYRFQGERNDGFNVLYQNMKCGLNAAKDLADLFREMSKTQEETSKAYIKMVKQVNSMPQFLRQFLIHQARPIGGK